VLLLLNGKSADSIEIGKEYARLRNIPEANIVRLDIAPPAAGSFPVMSPQEFERSIWEPATTAMKERGIDDHVLAWVYSTDFPVTIKSDPELSIQGLTFLRNKLPDPEKVKKGSFASALFGGPDRPEGTAYSSQTFDVLKTWLGDEMPLPSMTLGCLGEKGNTRDTVLNCLKKGSTSDGTRPDGTVYFVTVDDIRSKCREWQYVQARNELQRLGIRAEISKVFPAGGQKIIGMMTGAITVRPEDGNNVYVPGAMAEHLTSAAADFRNSDQTKFSAWIQAGATASAGTVTEPFCLWTKFPNAYFFVHYGSGCTMIESFFQSIRCPLQILLVGDPLAQPWAATGEIALDGIAGEQVSGAVQVGINVKEPDKTAYRKFMFLLDGKVVGNGRILQLDTAALSEGEHVLRAVAYKVGTARSQLFTEKKIIVRRAK
jgi:uncharacterized protein (TIGR03790 family)